MDLSNWTGFSNVANQQGGAVPLNTGAMTESQLAAMGLEVNATTGNVALRARPGEEVSVTKERVSSMGPKVDEALKAKALDQSKLFKTGRGLGSKDARADVIEKGSLVVEMPEGIEGGDMLQVNTATGLMFVNVPEDAPPLSRLEVSPFLLFCRALLAHFRRLDLFVSLPFESGQNFAREDPPDQQPLIPHYHPPKKTRAPTLTYLLLLLFLTHPPNALV